MKKRDMMKLFEMNFPWSGDVVPWTRGDMYDFILMLPDDDADPADEKPEWVKKLRSVVSAHGIEFVEPFIRTEVITKLCGEIERDMLKGIDLTDVTSKVRCVKARWLA